ncbi:MAG: hypothetical protein P1R58_01160 [bacterium]|nr:hypothetical protein [bacterium]
MIAVVMLVAAATLITACGQDSQSDPREVVISLFGAMERDDKAALAHLLDLAELMRNIDQDYAFHSDDTPRVFTSPQQILEDLTDNGLTKKRWFSLQRIISDTNVDGSTATVEVTFVDKGASKGYKTKFGLHIVNGKWKIYSFRAITSEG